MFLIYIINRKTEEEIGIVLKAVTKAVTQPSQKSLLDLFLTFLLRWLIQKSGYLNCSIDINRKAFTKLFRENVING